MKLGKKRAQFYLIGAVIIILVVVSIVAITNYTTTKKEPTKVYDITQIMEWENLQQVQQAEYTQSATAAETTSEFLNLLSDYLKENVNEDFSLIILYGDISSGNVVSGKVYTRKSLGNINTDLFDISMTSRGASDLVSNNTQIEVNPGGKTVNVTLLGEGANITETLPITKDNNFVFVMTTSTGFNRYVQTNLNKKQV